MATQDYLGSGMTREQAEAAARTRCRCVQESPKYGEGVIRCDWCTRATEIVERLAAGDCPTDD